MIFSKGCCGGYFSDTPVSSFPYRLMVSANKLSLNKCDFNSAKPRSTRHVVRDIRTLCLHVIYMRLHTGCVSVRTLDSSRRSEEIVKKQTQKTSKQTNPRIAPLSVIIVIIVNIAVHPVGGCGYLKTMFLGQRRWKETRSKTSCIRIINCWKLEQLSFK